MIKKLFDLNNILGFKYSKLFMILFMSANIIIKYKEIKVIKFNREIKTLKKYYKINENGILINKKKFGKNDNPRVSIISAVYNREKYILRFLRSIQNQIFDDIEIL